MATNSLRKQAFDTMARLAWLDDEIRGLKADILRLRQDLWSAEMRQQAFTSLPPVYWRGVACSLDRHRRRKRSGKGGPPAWAR